MGNEEMSVACISTESTKPQSRNCAHLLEALAMDLLQTKSKQWFAIYRNELVNEYQKVKAFDFMVLICFTSFAILMTEMEALDSVSGFYTVKFRCC